MKDKYTYKVACKDFVYGEKSKEQLNAYRKYFKTFDIGTEATLKHSSDEGDTFIVLSMDKTKAYYEMNGRLCYVLFKSRQETIAFEKFIRELRTKE